MRYRVEYTSSALRELGSLAGHLQQRIEERVLALAENPYPPGTKKLTGLSDHYRLRVGDYRVIYRVHTEILTVVIVRVRHRREAYR